MPARLSYLVMHPRREVFKVSALVMARRDPRPRLHTLYVFADEIAGNHDPCVLTDPWFYSYCHASQLRRTEIDTGSVLFFYDYSRDAFDTVFRVQRKHDWVRRAPSRPPLPIRITLSPRTEKLAWNLHFKWPAAGAHENANTTFEALMYPAKGHSLLPIRDDGPVGLEALGMPWIRRKIAERYRGKRPVPLTDRQAESLYRRIVEVSDLMALGRLSLVHPSDRRLIGKSPWAPQSTRRHQHCWRGGHRTGQIS